MKLEGIYFEVTPEDLKKLKKILKSGKYASQTDFLRMKIREEASHV